MRGPPQRGELDLDLVFDYTNIIQEQQTENEFLRFDLEYLRTLVSLKRGFGHGLELGFEVPFYIYYGGFLDPFVSNFHDSARTSQPAPGADALRARESTSTAVSVSRCSRGAESVGAVGEPTVRVKKILLRRRALRVLGTGSAQAPYRRPARSSAGAERPISVWESPSTGSDPDTGST